MNLTAAAPKAETCPDGANRQKSRITPEPRKAPDGSALRKCRRRNRSTEPN